VIVLGADAPLDLERYWRIVADHESVVIDDHALAHVGARRQAMEDHLAVGVPAYGVTTGLGFLADRPVAAADQADLQRSILVGRAAGVGEPYSERIVRGTMLLRLNGFLAGFAGVTAELCAFLAKRLNEEWFPVVPGSRHGAAGETIPLCHLFETLIGEGHVFVDSRIEPAAEALASAGAEPYELRLKEGLSLINGAPLGAALSADLARRASLLLATATDLAALTAALMGASWRPYSPRIAAMKGDPGQRAVAARLGELAGDAPDLDRPQAPVSLRVAPQVHGAITDVVEQLVAQAEREMCAITDSPLFLDAHDGEPEGFYPSGNFHSQALTFSLDATTVAMAQLGVLSERRLARLLDERYSALPHQLAADGARGGSGLVSLHKTVVGLCAENRTLAAPVSLHSGDTSSGQEDVQSFSALAAHQLGLVLDNVTTILAAEAVACRQAAGLHETLNETVATPRVLPSKLADLVATIAAHVEFVERDRSIAADLLRVAALVHDGALRAP